MGSLLGGIIIASKDLRSHLNWLFDKIGGQKAEIESLRGMGCELCVWCYWLSRSGHGGPILSPSQSKKLAELELELYIDVYFVGEHCPESEGAVGTN